MDQLRKFFRYIGPCRKKVKLVFRSTLKEDGEEGTIVIFYVRERHVLTTSRSSF